MSHAFNKYLKAIVGRPPRRMPTQTNGVSQKRPTNVFRDGLEK
jgi:hypothetical protein